MSELQTPVLPSHSITTLQTEGLKLFEKVGFPNKSHENWLYWTPRSFENTLKTPINCVKEPISEGQQIVIENGQLCSMPSIDGLVIEVSNSLDGMEACKFNVEHSSISLLNTAFFPELIVIRCQTQLDEPITIINQSTFFESASSAFCKVIIICEQQSSASFTVHHCHDFDETSSTNTTFEVIAYDHASCDINHVFSNNNSLSFFHSILQLHESSTINHLTSVMGSSVERHDTEVFFYKEQATVTLKGVAVLKGDEQFFNHLKINHFSKNCHCEQLFKTILDGKSISEFSGCVYVATGSHEVVSTQLNNNLMFSDTARALSRPQLIIDADDVQCDHGSTIGQLNPTEIHYIRSRGLTEKEARVLLSFGFIDEVLSTMVDVKARDGVVALIKQVIQDLSDYEPVKSFV